MKAKEITFGGIMVALGVLVLYFTTVIPINTLALLTLASCLIPITILRSNLKLGTMVYVATSFISFFILPINYFLMYALFFGVYGLIKYFIEKIGTMPIEIVIKLIFFNIILFLLISFLNSFMVDLKINLPMWQFIIASEICFLVYDYAITIIISWYIKKFKNI